MSCANREYEWVKGRNAKGKEPATYAPLFAAEIGIELQDGSVEAWLFKVQHQAEIVARALRIMDHTPGTTRVVAVPRPGPAIWNPQTRTFEYQCSRCGAVGLVLERTVLMHATRDGRIERHRWCCEGDPPGKGWVFAKMRQPLQAMHVDAVAEWLSSDPELKGETPGMWTPTAHTCACGAGQVEAQRGMDGRWQTRCRSCGASAIAEKAIHAVDQQTMEVSEPPKMETPDRRQQLEKARELLADHDCREMPTHQVAAACGFNSDAAFYKAFKAQFGAPPGRFRKQGDQP